MIKYIVKYYNASLSRLSLVHGYKLPQISPIKSPFFLSSLTGGIEAVFQDIVGVRLTLEAQAASGVSGCQRMSAGSSGMKVGCFKLRKKNEWLPERIERN